MWGFDLLANFTNWIPSRRSEAILKATTGAGSASRIGNIAFTFLRTLIGKLLHEAQNLVAAASLALEISHAITRKTCRHWNNCTDMQRRWLMKYLVQSRPATPYDCLGHLRKLNFVSTGVTSVPTGEIWFNSMIGSHWNVSSEKSQVTQSSKNNLFNFCFNFSFWFEEIITIQNSRDLEKSRHVWMTWWYVAVSVIAAESTC